MHARLHVLQARAPTAGEPRRMPCEKAVTRLCCLRTSWHLFFGILSGCCCRRCYHSYRWRKQEQLRSSLVALSQGPVPEQGERGARGALPVHPAAHSAEHIEHWRQLRECFNCMFSHCKHINVCCFRECARACDDTLPDFPSVSASSRCLDSRPPTTHARGLVAVWTASPDTDLVVVTQAQVSHTQGLRPWCRTYTLVLLLWECRGLGGP